VDGSFSGLFESAVLAYSRPNRKPSSLNERKRGPGREPSPKLPECKAGLLTLDSNSQSWTEKQRRTPHLKYNLPTRTASVFWGVTWDEPIKQCNRVGIFSTRFSLQTRNDLNLITGLSLEASDERHYLRRSQTSVYNLIRQTLQNYDVNTAPQLQYNAHITTSMTTENS
jgi:hypothetical protein